jgi:hypothetical protein
MTTGIVKNRLISQKDKKKVLELELEQNVSAK